MQKLQKKTNKRIEKVLDNRLAVRTWKHFTKILQQLFDEVKKEITRDKVGEKFGANADYIPYLDENHVNPDSFGVAVCSIDGQVSFIYHLFFLACFFLYGFAGFSIYLFGT